MPSAYAPPSTRCASSRTPANPARATPGITMRATPASRAADATASRSASNSEASRWQCVSIHMRQSSQALTLALARSDRNRRLLVQHAFAQTQYPVAARGQVLVVRDDHEARLERAGQF